ncbi:MAG: ArgE/DapE family deacylase [Acidimicrobiia bacterium]|nr:ArgE/DapE family deacylase [Acidimicrobiia bacterium]
MTGANDNTAAVAARRDDLVELTSAFVAIPSENPPDVDLRAAQRWLSAQLDHFEIDHDIIDSSSDGGDHRVVVGTVGSDGPLLYLHGHYDVVPAFDPAQFAPTVADGAIVGRGAADMKSGLVAMLLAAVIHRDAGRSGRIKLVFVPDEETGGAHGSERLQELGVITDDGAVGAIVAEPSFPDIWCAARGALTIEVTVAGRAAHVGHHYTGVNAFTAAHEVVQELIDYQTRVVEHRTELRIEPEAARHSIMLIGGTAAGGTNFNIVPDVFRFTIDRRPNPDEDYDRARAELLAVLDDLAERFDLGYRILQDVDPAHTPPGDQLVTVLHGAIAEVAGRHASLTMCPGCLETRVYNRAGIPAVAYGPGPSAVMHGPDEHVPIANLLEACEVYVTVLERLLARPDH